MMSRLIRGGFLLAIMGVMAPNVTEAGLFRCLFGHGHCSRQRICNDCRRVQNLCRVCQHPPVQCTCTTFTPVVETCYEKQQHVSYREFCETHYRQETHVKKVPVTTYTNVTVDEGSYKMVWVPRPVTRKVPCTTYQDRAYTRTIPYQVRRRVPEYTTRWIPHQRVRYVQQQTSTFAHPGGATCESPGHGVPHFMAPTAPPASATPPMNPSTPVPNPTPDPQLNQTQAGHPYNEWMPITSTHNHQRPVSSTSKRSGRFKPAPSAAAVWNSRRSLARP